VKFQRSAENFLNRFGAATSHWSPNALVELAPQVVPVVVLGDDRVDAERAQYGIGQGAAAGVGQLAAVAFVSLAGDVELEQVQVYASAATTASVFTDDTDGAATWGSIVAPAFVIAAPIAGGPITRTAVAGAFGAGIGGGQYRLPLAANVPTTLFQVPFVLPRARRFVVQLVAANLILNVNALVRDRLSEP